MYLDELRREQHGQVLAAIQRWERAIGAVMGALGRLRQLFAINRSDTLTRFQVHRVPGTDTLR